jgi:hypothetical protein
MKNKRRQPGQPSHHHQVGRGRDEPSSAGPPIRLPVISSSAAARATAPSAIQASQHAVDARGHSVEVAAQHDHGQTEQQIKKAGPERGFMGCGGGFGRAKGMAPAQLTHAQAGHGHLRRQGT